MNELKFHEYRRKAGKTSTQVAREADINKSTLTNYLKGRRKPPMHVAAKIAKAVGYEMDPEGLFKEDQDGEGTEAADKP